MLPTYAKRLKEARTKAKLTQLQVMQHTGINNKTLSGYENGISEPDYGTLKDLCDLFEVSTDWVLGNTNNPHGELTTTERDLVTNLKLDMPDSEIIKMFPNMEFEGRKMSEAQKKTLVDMARFLLRQDQ